MLLLSAQLSDSTPIRISDSITILFSNTISVSDIIATITVFLVIIGGAFTYYQYHQSFLLKRADYINELTEHIRTDSDIKEIVYMFDYSKKWYNASFHGSGGLENQVDKTLSYFSYICYLKSRRIIGKREWVFFEYEVERILCNCQVQDYLYNLYHFSNKIGVPITFQCLYEFGKKKRYFSKDFFYLMRI